MSTPKLEVGAAIKGLLPNKPRQTIYLYPEVFGELRRTVIRSSNVSVMLSIPARSISTASPSLLPADVWIYRFLELLASVRRLDVHKQT
jgi:hypothetical protein